MLRWIEINCIEKAKKWSLTWTRWRNERIILRSSYFFLFLSLSKETSYLRRKKPIYKTESIISRPGFTSTPFQFSFVSTIDGLYGRISKGNWFPSRMKIISIWLSKTYVMNRNDRYQLFLLTLICLFPFSPPLSSVSAYVFQPNRSKWSAGISAQNWRHACCREFGITFAHSPDNGESFEQDEIDTRPYRWSRRRPQRGCKLALSIKEFFCRLLCK